MAIVIIAVVAGHRHAKPLFGLPLVQLPTCF
jgi:hypothetical protein